MKRSTMPDLAGARGVLPVQWLRKARDRGVIVSPIYTLDEAQFQPASIDLRLGEWAYRLRCSFLPCGSSVKAKLPAYTMGRIDLRDGAVLERNRPYLIPLVETLNLPPGLAGRANPKSSTGRLDIFTRVITDHGVFFDDIRAGYQGPLYLEVVSRSFTIRVQRGLSLNQLRLMVPTTPLMGQKLRDAHAKDPLLLLSSGQPLDQSDPSLGTNGVFVSLELGEGNSRERVGWRARRNSQLLDLSKERSYDPEEFWEPVFAERGGGVILEPEEFYLLLSKECVRIWPDLAAEMVAVDTTSGELRTHYAGFFDPGFGYSKLIPQIGSRVALEVRAHDVPFMVEDGQRVCRLAFEPLIEAPDTLYGRKSHYQFQTSTLSKHFADSEGGDRKTLSFNGSRSAEPDAAELPPLF